MPSVASAPANGATISYTLTFAPAEYADVKASAARGGISVRAWLYRSVRASLTPAVVAERALAKTLPVEEVA